MKNKEIYRDLPTLTTPRLILRKLLESDAHSVFEYAQNPNVARFTSWNVHEQLEDSRKFLELVITGYNNGEPQPYGIELKETGKLIGTIGLLDLNEDSNRIEIGYALSENYWGRGLTTEAAKKLIEFGFSLLKFNKISSCCVTNNFASEKVMNKIGMKYEGLFKHHAIKNGEFLDIKYYGLLYGEWSKRH